MKTYPSKVCPTCEAPFEGQWLFCCNACIDEGVTRAQVERKLLKLIEQNLSLEKDLTRDFMQVSQMFRDFIASREEYGLPIEYLKELFVKHEKKT